MMLRALLLCALLAAPGLAAARWYQVEVVVFRHNVESAAGGEQWPAMTELPDFSDSMDLITDLPAMGDEPGDTQTPQGAGPNGPPVLEVDAAKSAAITRLDIWTGTTTADVRPSAYCKQAGKRSGAEHQLADFYLPRCRETIKAGRSRAYCYKGGGGIPFLRGAAINAVSIEAGSAGQDTVNAIGNATKCPNSVTQRQKPKKR